MSQAPSLQQLANRIVRLEREMDLVQRELTDLKRQQRVTSQAAPSQLDISRLWAVKEEQKHWIATLFSNLSIQGAPIGSRMPQEKMGRSGLAPEELSHDIVKAREE